MGKNSEYYKGKEQRQRGDLNRLLDKLPPLCKELIEFKEQSTALSTLVSYCYDLGIFFRYYIALPESEVEEMKNIGYAQLDLITQDTIVAFQKYLAGEGPDITGENHVMSKKGVARKMASVRNLFRYHHAMGNIKQNPCAMVLMPKLAKDKSITRMSKKEVTALLNALSKQTIFKRGRQRSYKKKTKHRDMAIITLLLNTGIRVSECVGLDITDVDLREQSITVIRKGGNADTVFFNNDVKDNLKTYIKGERAEIVETHRNSLAKPKNKNAFFLSIQGNRMSVDAIERMVKSYTSRVIPNKHITPHKLRSTYGSELYKATGDIRLVAEVLGHENINTTIKFYADFDNEMKKKAAKAVNLTKKSRYLEESAANETIDTAIDNIANNVEKKSTSKESKRTTTSGSKKSKSKNKSTDTSGNSNIIQFHSRDNN